MSIRIAYQYRLPNGVASSEPTIALPACLPSILSPQLLAPASLCQAFPLITSQLLTKPSPLSKLLISQPSLQLWQINRTLMTFLPVTCATLVRERVSQGVRQPDASFPPADAIPTHPRESRGGYVPRRTFPI